MPLNQARQHLQASRKSIRCHELVELLESLGFTVRDGKRGGHKVFTHPHLPAFHSASFNCGHGRNPEIKPAYIRNVLRVLDTHEDELRAHLSGRENSTD